MVISLFVKSVILTPLRPKLTDLVQSAVANMTENNEDDKSGTNRQFRMSAVRVMVSSIRKVTASVPFPCANTLRSSPRTKILGGFNTLQFVNQSLLFAM